MPCGNSEDTSFEDLLVNDGASITDISAIRSLCNGKYEKRRHTMIAAKIPSRPLALV